MWFPDGRPQLSSALILYVNRFQFLKHEPQISFAAFFICALGDSRLFVVQRIAGWPGRHQSFLSAIQFPKSVVAGRFAGLCGMVALVLSAIKGTTKIVAKSIAVGAYRSDSHRNGRPLLYLSGFSPQPLSPLAGRTVSFGRLPLLDRLGCY